MTPEQAENTLALYLEVEDRLASILDIVPYATQNETVSLPKLSSIIVEAGSLVDAVFREQVQTSKKRDDLNISDFADFFERTRKLSSIRTLTYRWPHRLLRPFEPWSRRDTRNAPARLVWWDAYNRLKHQRLAEIPLSTLHHSVHSVCALHQVLSQLPDFLPHLHRHDLIASRLYDVDYLIRAVSRGEPLNGFVMMESRLFGTPIGQRRFPADISKISDADTWSERLGKVLAQNA